MSKLAPSIFYVAAVFGTGNPMPLHADVGAFASIRQAVLYTKSTGADGLKVVDAESRFGLAGNQEIGPVTGFGLWEWGVDANSLDSTPEIRLGYVGISGDFGAISIGSQNTAWNASVGSSHTSFVDEGFWQSGDERNGNSLKFARLFGDVSLEADAVLEETDGAANDAAGGIDEIQLAVAMDVGVLNIQAAVVNRDDGFKGGGSLVGGQVSYTAEPLTVSLAVARDDDDFAGAEQTLGVKLRTAYETGPHKFLAVLTQADNSESASKPNGIAIGYEHNLSKRTRVALEMSSVDPDIAGLDATTEGGVMYRHDW